MVKKISVGNKASDFCLPDASNKKVCLKDFKGKWVVLYFYPRDNTSGCTKEAVDFSEHLSKFRRMGAVVVGISPDSSTSHTNFIAKHNLKLILLSDIEHEVLEKYGVWQKKKMYGREYFGVVRTTFVINPRGKVRKVWERVKVAGHAEAVKDYVVTSCKRTVS